MRDTLHAEFILPSKNGQTKTKSMLSLRMFFIITSVVAPLGSQGIDRITDLFAQICYLLDASHMLYFKLRQSIEG